jgi:hypothetical protein
MLQATGPVQIEVSMRSSLGLVHTLNADGSSTHHGAITSIFRMRSQRKYLFWTQNVLIVKELWMWFWKHVEFNYKIGKWRNLFYAYYSVRW